MFPAKDHLRNPFKYLESITIGIHPLYADIRYFESNQVTFRRIIKVFTSFQIFRTKFWTKCDPYKKKRSLASVKAIIRFPWA